MSERPGEQGAAVSQRDAIFYEQQEERPLVHMEELGMRDAPITHITASPMPRRSTLSRLSSMINPRDADHETTRIQPDGSTHQQRSIHRDSLEIARESQRRRSHRSSLFGAVSSGSAPGLRGNRENVLAAISRPFSLRGSPTNSSSFLTVSSRTNVLHRQNSHASSRIAQGSAGVGDSSSSRFARFRRYISLSLDARPAILTATAHDHDTPTFPHRPTRRVLRDRDLQALPRMGTTAPTTNLNLISGSNHSHIQEMHRAGPERTLTTIDGGSTRTRRSSWTERWSDPSIMGRRESRRVPSSHGSRSTRFIRRDPDGHLPRILSLAAFAIAAQLTGSTERTSGDLQAIGPDALDGNLHNLYQALQDNLYRAAGDSGTAEDDNDNDRPAGPANPLNYLRVFRFVSDATNNEGQQEPSSRGILGESNRTDDQAATTETRREEAGGRTITLVVVGVRSVPRGEASRNTRPTSEPNLDPLSDFPQLVPASEYLSDASGGLMSDTNGRARLASHRRASSGSIGNFPANYDSQRHQRTTATTHSSYVDTLRASGSVTPTGLPSTALSDSPAGPHPPPSTPAEPVLSAYSSQGTTPSRRPSSASAVQQSHLPLREAVTSQNRGSAVLSTEGQEQPQRRVQQRRRSDTEFARHRDLGAGASRRNGVVAPDDGDASVPAASRSRSWLIYVVGTNLAQDHPALTAPSLFTDVSTIEAKARV